MAYDPTDPERYASVADVKADRNIAVSDFDGEITDALAATSFYLDEICGLPDPYIDPPVPRPDAVVWRLMTRRLTARWWDRRNSPTGVEGGFADIPVYIRGVDPDIDALIISRRSRWGIAGGHQDLVDVP